jgi:hypothetical protein
VTSGACIAKVCKNNKNICQIRLDFDTFEISGPSTSEDVIAKLTFGVNAATGTKIYCYLYWHAMPRGSSICFFLVLVETLVKILLYSPILYNFIMPVRF